jgi:hypothetical protein
MEHVPALTMVTKSPITLQIAAVVEWKLTLRPEEAVARSVNGAAPEVTPLIEAKVIVCDADPPVTVNDRITGVAAP